jgi:DNA invertase Pin-like site-specific DNA recombinase
MRIVGYIRVSTNRQVERGFGLDVQERTVRAWIRSGGHTLTRIHRDEGVSGSNGLADRIGLVDALEEIRDGKATGLVVPRLDRLARDLIVQEQILSEVRRLKGEVFSCSAAEAGYLTDDPDDPSRKLIRQVLGAVSEYERSMVALRLRSGRRRKAERGGYAYGSPHYGTKAENKALVADDAEQATLDRIRELHGEGASLRTIAETLTAEGYAPRTSKLRKSDHWHPESLRRIIARL